MLIGLLSFSLAASFVAPASAQVVINEILANPGSTFDGAEFIELRNKGGAAVSIAGWVLMGTEFNGTCGGEDRWQFPAGASIPAGGYVVVAKDNIDAAGSEQDGFRERFGFDANFELYDADRTFEFNDPTVPNMILLNNEASFDDQIRLIPGNGFSAACVGFNQYEALYLYNGNPPVGTIVDAIEYKDPVNCGNDTCTDINGLNDAFAGLPGVGETLGRDAFSTDTGNSSADLKLGTNTPGAANIANPGPVLDSLAVNNPDPLVGQSVTVSIVATDAQGIGSIYVVYTPEGGSADSVAMTLSFGSTYSGTIPPQPDTVPYTYFVRARDAGSPAGVGVSKYPDFGSRGIRWGTQSIFDVQFHTPPTDVGASTLVGDAVNIEGIVTAENGLYNAGTFVISFAAGIWNSVHCFDNTGTTVVQRGDSVRVAGVVQEYFNLTEVSFFGPQSVTILASGKPLPGPTALTASQIANATPIGEALEGTYGRLNNVQVTLADDGFGQFEVTDGTGTGLVGDDAFYLYTPTLGDSLVAVEGVVAYSFSERKLEPRDDADIIGPPIISNIRYAPIPPLASPAPLKISATITDNGTITRAKLIYSNNGAPNDSLNLVNVSGSNWEVSIAAIAGPRIIYHIEVTDNTGFNARGPSLGDFDLYRGLVTIESVQTPGGGSDASPVAGLPRNVAGIVTMEPGMVADNIFTIQNHWVTDPAYRGIQVFTGGSTVGLIELGDSVAVSGDVVEYFEKTQIDLHFTEAFNNYGQVGELPGFALDTNDVPPDSTGAIPVAEPWESVLVQMSSSIITNANAGFGQYYIDNTAPKTGQECLVDDEARFGALTFTPTLGESLTVRGTVDYAFGQYKIQPRNNSDILPYNPANAVSVDVEGQALAFALHQNNPNPFDVSGTHIAFALERPGVAKLRVFDVQGRVVRTLVNGALDAGRHFVDWNGMNDGDRRASAGVYFYRLEASGESLTRKMTLLR
jgi:DNA/RNA endonuclease YhcR with UshA esterase domain